MSDIKLYQEKKPYKTKDGQERIATNFFLQLGSSLVPIEVKYFKGKDDNGDPNYKSRKSVVEAFALPLPPKNQ